MIDPASPSSESMQKLERGLREATRGVQIPGAEIDWEYESYSTDYFPLRSFASGSVAGNSDPERVLVVSVQAHRPEGQRGERIELYADVAWEGNAVLSESPKTVVSLEDPGLTEKLSETTITLQQWLDEQMPLIARELRRQLQADQEAV